MSGDEAAARSPQLSLSGFSSLFSLDVPLPSLSVGVGVGAGGEEKEEGDQVVNSGGPGTTAHVRMMKNRESGMRSRARKRAYMQELEKEVRRLVDDNLRLKRQCRQLKMEKAALIQQQSNQQHMPAASSEHACPPFCTNLLQYLPGRLHLPAASSEYACSEPTYLAD